MEERRTGMYGGPMKSWMAISATATTPPTPRVREVAIVPMPSIDVALGSWQDTYTRAGQLGMPAHVTLVAPHDASSTSSAALRDALRGAAATTSTFDAVFDRTSRFADENLITLPAEPQPFQALHDAVEQRLESSSPRRHDFVPHVSIAMRSRGAPIDDIEHAVRELLPLTEPVNEAWIMRRSGDEPWRIAERVPLGPLPRDPA
jgi:2'-5' RNA ligase